MNETFWTKEPDGDSRHPIPTPGAPPRVVYDRINDRHVYARCVAHGVLHTTAGANYRSCEWEIIEPAPVVWPTDERGYVTPAKHCRIDHSGNTRIADTGQRDAYACQGCGQFYRGSELSKL